MEQGFSLNGNNCDSHTMFVPVFICKAKKDRQVIALEDHAGHLTSIVKYETICNCRAIESAKVHS